LPLANPVQAKESTKPLRIESIVTAPTVSDPNASGGLSNNRAIDSITALTTIPFEQPVQRTVGHLVADHPALTQEPLPHESQPLKKACRGHVTWIDIRFDPP
jgi:hypothetical protein